MTDNALFALAVGGLAFLIPIAGWLGTRRADPRSNGTTEGHEPGVLPQGMTFHAGELAQAYIAGARSGRDHLPTDEQIARSVDAYVKLAHVQRIDR